MVIIAKKGKKLSAKEKVQDSIRRKKRMDFILKEDRYVLRAIENVGELLVINQRKKVQDQDHINNLIEILSKLSRLDDYYFELYAQESLEETE